MKIQNHVYWSVTVNLDKKKKSQISNLKKMVAYNFTCPGSVLTAVWTFAATHASAKVSIAA
jgi:hypothetical protein